MKYHNCWMNFKKHKNCEIKEMSKSRKWWKNMGNHAFLGVLRNFAQDFVLECLLISYLMVSSTLFFGVFSGFSVFSRKINKMMKKHGKSCVFGGLWKFCSGFRAWVPSYFLFNGLQPSVFWRFFGFFVFPTKPGFWVPLNVTFWSFSFSTFDFPYLTLLSSLFNLNF